ncbi:MAG: hypothetical protein NTV54_10395 [Ignavibacteriales bacterium]|nr:hypothetical protein [Ignavibacteriales bacterium]
MISVKRIVLLCLIAAHMAAACTTVIIAAKASKSGRPIIWKNRDTDSQENKFSYCKGDTYDFVGVYNLSDSSETECYMGSNSVGLCLINTASYNLQYAKYKGKMDQEGVIMRRGLATCKTVHEFEQMLRSTNGSRGVEANFGAIDAKGGAAYFESTPYSFVKYDVNDPQVAPHGYLVRTNYSFCGTVEDGQGYIRYTTANDAVYWGLLSSLLTPEFILTDVVRGLSHSLTGSNLWKTHWPANAREKTMIPFSDYILRFSTASSLIMEGVTSGEDPLLTTLWLSLGNPLVTPVVPVWVGSKDFQPEMLLSSHYKPAPLNAWSLAWKNECFPVKTPEGERYMNLAPLLNREETGYLQRITAFDGMTMQSARVLVEELHKDGNEKRCDIDFRSGTNKWKNRETGETVVCRREDHCTGNRLRPGWSFRGRGR